MNKNPKSSQCVLGIDPGLSGAVAMIDEDRNIITIQCTPTLVVKKGKGNRTVYVESAMTTIIEACKDSGTIVSIGIENVHAMPGQGVTSMFSLGLGYGLWIGIISALRLPHTRIEPQTWKKALGIKSGSDKRASVARALQLFPRAYLMRSDRARVESDGMADALLIAEYTRRMLNGSKA